MSQMSRCCVPAVISDRELTVREEKSQRDWNTVYDRRDTDEQISVVRFSIQNVSAPARTLKLATANVVYQLSGRHCACSSKRRTSGAIAALSPAATAAAAAGDDDTGDTGVQLSLGEADSTACARRLANVNVLFLLFYITCDITETSGTASKYLRCKLRPNRWR